LADLVAVPLSDARRIKRDVDGDRWRSKVRELDSITSQLGGLLTERKNVRAGTGGVGRSEALLVLIFLGRSLGVAG